MSWIYIVIIAYLILALVNLIDKYLLDKVLPDGKFYAFFISALGALVLLAAPWFLVWPGTGLLLFQLAVGAIYPLALFFMFQALKHGDASKVTVMIGGLIPIFALVLAYFFMRERYTTEQWIGIFYLLLGTFIIALVASDKRLASAAAVKNKKAAFYFSLASALVFALFFVGTKFSYNHHNFVSSFIWIRIGALLGAALMLVRRKDRREIFRGLKSGRRSSSVKNRILLFGSQALGALGFILQNYAISFGSVAIINALQGVQYAFLLILGWFFTVFNPRIIKENISRAVMIPKIIAVILVGFGLFFLTI